MDVDRRPVGTGVGTGGWGKLSPTTMTAPFPLDPPPATCAAHPRADVFVHAPTAFVGGAASDQTFVQGGTTVGACVSGHAISPGGWIGTAPVPRSRAVAAGHVGRLS